MRKIYCLSGIGADERVFCNISIPGYELVHLSWIKPGTDETLQQYAHRIAKLIEEPNPVILGLSFGGMLVTEIAKAIPVKKAFLISSAKTKAELPRYNQAVSALIRSRILPPFVFSTPNYYICKLFGAQTKDEKQFLNGVIRDADGAFVKWASRAIMGWNNEVVPPDMVHIHGTNDLLLPSAASKPNYWIEGGTHLMVYTRGAEISKIIEDELAA